MDYSYQSQPIGKQLKKGLKTNKMKEKHLYMLANKIKQTIAAIIIVCTGIALESCRKDELKITDYECAAEKLPPPTISYIGIPDYGENILIRTKHDAVSAIIMEAPESGPMQTNTIHIDKFEPADEGIYYGYLDIGACRSVKMPLELKQGLVQAPCNHKNNWLNMDKVLENYSFDSSYVFYNSTGFHYRSNKPQDPMIDISIESGIDIRPGCYLTMHPAVGINGIKQGKVNIAFKGANWIPVENQIVYIVDTGDYYEAILCDMRMYYNASISPRPETTLNLKLKVKK
jgi:hypothetical protein